MAHRKQLRATPLDYNPLEPKNLLAQIDILAAGTTNQESIELQIDGQTVQTFNNLGGDAYAGQFVTLTHNTANPVSADQIRIAFTNDLYDPANNIDRNVRIDTILIDGVRYETEGPNVYSTGTWKAEDGVSPGFRQSEFLHTDGYFQYDSDGNTGTQIDVVARGDEGGERFELRIDGNTVASYQVTNLDATYSYTAPGNVQANQVQVFFTNDLWSPVDSIDRNLIVDSISVDGTRYESEGPNVYSTGTWKAEDGIAPGFRQSEYLHANGYFHYDQVLNPGIINLETSVINVPESAGTVDFNIVRSGGSDGVVTVDYRTIAISASEGDDFQPREGTVTFQDGETSKTISVTLVDDSLIEPDEQFSFAIDNVTGGASLLAPRTATATIDDNDSVLSQGDGLLGEYFDARGFANRFQNRVDARVDFDWGSGAPVNGMGADSFSVRWSGQIEPRFNETYTFTTRSDDGVRLWVDNQLIIDQWNDHSATNHSGTISLLAGQLYNIRMEFYENGGDAVAQLSWASNSQAQEIVPQSQLYAADPPPPEPGDELVTQNLITGLVQPTAMDFNPSGSKMYIAEQRGIVRVVDNGVLATAPFLDFRDRVNGTRDRGLLDIAIHPDFENTPYVYLLYTYDPPEVNNYSTGTLQGPDGKGNRAARLTRVTADASTDYTSIVSGSEVVLIGKNSTWDNFNGFANSTIDFNEPPAGILADGSNLNDFIATDSESHTVGSVEFGTDGSLFVSIGDGTSYNRADPRTVRVQDIDNLSGKILRVDPITGEGLSTNPFYNGDADANRSKVYQYGLRNPFRISVNPDSGDLYIGDVGWTQWEEVNSAEAGANFGWPYYEGGSGTNSQTRDYRDFPEAQAFYSSGLTATPSIYALNHAADGINAIVLGDVYNGDTYPAEYRGDLFFNDLGQGIVRNISFDSAGNITSVDTFTTGAEIVVQIVQGPDGNLYFVDLRDGTIGRWVFQDSSAASIAATQAPNAPVVPHSATGSASGITVAVIDTGIDAQHPNLSSSIWTNTGEIPNDGIDNDDNGYIDDVHGYNFFNQNGRPRDLNGHGTFSAGIIAGIHTADSPFEGIATGSQLMNLRVTNGMGDGTGEDVALAIRYAVDNGAQIISLPLEVELSEAVRSAMAHAAENQVFVVVPAGNDGAETPTWMASLSRDFNNVISVGAITVDGTRLSDSNRVGDSGTIQIDATGIAFSTQPGNQFATYRGTSVSVAHTAAAAALALAASPDLNADQLRHLLIASASSPASGSDSIGTLDIEKALSDAIAAHEVVIEKSGNRITVNTSPYSDHVAYQLGRNVITINGIAFSMGEMEDVDRLIIDAQTGSDRLTVYGTEADESALIQSQNTRIGNSQFSLVGNQFDFVTFFGNQGNDSLNLYGSSGNDLLTANSSHVSIASDEFYRGGYGFEAVRAYSNGGQDQANFTGTSENDRVLVTPTLARLTASGVFRQATGFQDIQMDLLGGFDPVILRGDEQQQTLRITPNSAALTSEEFSAQIYNLERTTSHGSGGDDSLVIHDGSTRDVVNTRPQNTLLVGVGYDHRAYGFESTSITSSGGLDRATIQGSDQSESLVATPLSSKMTGDNYETELLQFPSVLVLAGEGSDQATVDGSLGDDTYYHSQQLSHWTYGDYSLTLRQFETESFDGNQGSDQVTLIEGTGDSLLQLASNQAILQTDQSTVTVSHFDSLRAKSQSDSGTDLIEYLDQNLDYLVRELGDWEHL